MKNQARSFRSGPPSVPPNWLRLYLGLGAPSRFRKKLLAFRSVFRLNSYTLPWMLLVPDLVTAATLPPALRPAEASYILVCTMNSWSESMDGTERLGFSPVPIEFASTPLMIMLLESARWPLTYTATSPRPNSEEFPTEPEAPAVIANNCWKLRVGNGSESISFSSMTVPRAELSVCTSGDWPVTETVVGKPATLRATSATVLAVIWTTMPCSLADANPLEVTSSRYAPGSSRGNA